MFTVSQRDALLELVVGLANRDDRVVAGALVSSLASEKGGDAWSDLDVTFAVDDCAGVGEVLADLELRLSAEHGAVALVALKRTPAEYRILLFPDGLQLDVSMAPASAFRAGGPSFRLMFGEVAGDAAPATDGPTSTIFLHTPATQRGD